MARSELMGADAFAAATPDDRDRVVDLVRAGAIVAVVLGHWLLAVVSWDEGGLEGANLLQVAPWTRGATWVLQVMPLFFVVGGVANSASWASARRRAIGFPAWMHGRLDRLVRPVVALALTWSVGLAVARAAGVRASTLRTAAELVAMPVWFLAVYVAVVAATPVMVGLHRRFGVAVLLALAGSAALCDVAAGPLDVPVVGWANFAFVWLFAHQLGFAWRDGALDRRSRAWLLTGVGLAGLLLLTGPLGYPSSMVGGPGERSNTTPPTTALLALTLAQTGLLLLFRSRLAVWVQRPQVWRRVVAANGVAMTLYLWHLTALCLATVMFLPTGLLPQPEAATVSWWLLRPPWLLALTALLVPLVALWSRIETRARPVRVSRIGRAAAGQAVLGALSASAGLTAISLGGLPVLGGSLVLPALGLGLLLLGVVLVRTTLLKELRPRRLRRHHQRQGRGASGAAAARRPQSSTVSSSARASDRIPAAANASASTWPASDRRSILRRWPKPVRTRLKRRTESLAVAGAGRRMISTRADSTRGRGRNTSGPTRPITRARAQ